MNDKNANCQTPLPARKRQWVPGSATRPNVYSAFKRRRMSLVDDEGDFDGFESEPAHGGKVDVSDRFISARKERAIPLQTTPRTQRMAKFFGLADDRVLKFTDTNSEPSGKNAYLNRHRFNFHQLLKKPHEIPSTSAEANIGTRKQFILALDGPGIPADLFAYPISWSMRNAIAVACGLDVYYQDLNTRQITHLMKLPNRYRGKLVSIEWSPSSPNMIAAGTMNGDLQLWDADTKKCLSSWQDKDEADVGGLSWTGDLLAVGMGDGAISLYDARAPNRVGRIEMHKDKVHGLRWRHDGNYLASSDQAGVVQIWDARASRAITLANRYGSKMKHHAPVKALAWCPWKPEMLATGTMYPDGKIRIWNINNPIGTTPPTHLIPVNTSVTSLLWSPHCKEILSTHGMSWQPRSGPSESCPSLVSPSHLDPNDPSAGPSTGRRRTPRTRPVPVKTALTNSLSVHAYPSMRRVLSVAAHSGPIGHSCLSPDGTMVFSICPAEEAMKMWRVWGVPPKAERRESVFDKCTIR